MNYSDYIVNEAQLGTTAMAGVIGSLCSIAGTISGFVVAFWIKATRKFSMSLAFILCGVSMLLPQLTQSAIGCYAGGILCQFFNLIVSPPDDLPGLATQERTQPLPCLCLPVLRAPACSSAAILCRLWATSLAAAPE